MTTALTFENFYLKTGRAVETFRSVSFQHFRYQILRTALCQHYCHFTQLCQHCHFTQRRFPTYSLHSTFPKFSPAVRCSVLRRVAVRCSALQCVAVRCGALQCVAVCYTTSSHDPATHSVYKVTVVASRLMRNSTRATKEALPLLRWKILKSELATHFAM